MPQKAAETDHDDGQRATGCGGPGPAPRPWPGRDPRCGRRRGRWRVPARSRELHLRRATGVGAAAGVVLARPGAPGPGCPRRPGAAWSARRSSRWRCPSPATPTTANRIVNSGTVPTVRSSQSPSRAMITGANANSNDPELRCSDRVISVPAEGVEAAESVGIGMGGPAVRTGHVARRRNACETFRNLWRRAGVRKSDATCHRRPTPVGPRRRDQPAGVMGGGVWTGACTGACGGVGATTCWGGASVTTGWSRPEARSMASTIRSALDRDS